MPDPMIKREQSGTRPGFAERRGGRNGVEISKTDLQKAIIYLEDATRLYDALAVLPMQKCNSRSYMIKQLITKLKTKLK